MRNCQKQQRKDETVPHPKGDIKNSAKHETDSDGGLHLRSRFTCPTASNEGPYRGPNAPRGKQYADARRGFTGYRKDPFAKHGQQSKNAATESPGRFDQQICQNSRMMIYVTRALQGLSDPQGLADSQFRLGPPRPIGEAHTAD